MRLLFPTLLLPAVALAGTGFDGTWKTDMESLKTTGKPLVLLLAGGECACSSCNPPYTVKADGAEHKVTGQVQTVSDELTAKRVAAAPADSHPLSGSWVERQHVGGDLRPVRYRMTAEGFQMRWNGQARNCRAASQGAPSPSATHRASRTTGCRLFLLARLARRVVAIRAVPTGVFSPWAAGMHRKLRDVTNPGTPFSPIGGTLATGRADSTVKLWDTTTLASRA